jgi:osmoprotectant transport system substrate-binding protein
MAFNNTYCLMMREADAERLKIRTLSDLAARIAEKPNELRIVVTNEFYARADGLPGMASAYGMKPSPGSVRQMEPGLIYLAVRDGDAQVGVGFTTDGRIRAYKLRALEDDRGFFPPYNPCFVLRKDVYEGNRDKIDAPFLRLGKLLTEPAMTELNFEAAEKKRDPGRVAEEFLRKNGLIR